MNQESRTVLIAEDHSYSEVAAIERVAQAHARRMALARLCPLCDVEDIEQEIALAILRKMPAYDPRRSSYRTFCEIVATSRAKSLARSYRASVRLGVGEPPSDTLAAPNPSPDLSIDVRSVLARADRTDRCLALMLIEYTPTEASRILRTSRGEIYRGIGRLRLAFIAAGLEPQRRKSRRHSS